MKEIDGWETIRQIARESAQAWRGLPGEPDIEAMGRALFLQYAHELSPDVAKMALGAFFLGYECATLPDGGGDRPIP